MWKMFHEKNAIEGASITVRFGEPLSSMVGKKALRQLEGLAHAEGFIDRQPLQQIQFQLSPGNPKPDFKQSPISGMMFQHNSIARDLSGNVVQQLSRQLVFQPEQVAMQIPRYRGWDIEWPATLSLFTAAIKVASTAVPVGGFRLEYLNRFVFDGIAEESDILDLLKPTDLMAPHVFSATDFWHSHSGRFDDITETSRRLIQVNADLQDFTSPQPFAGKRTLSLLLAVERQFTPNGLELDPDDVAEALERHFSSLHSDIHVLLKKLIDSDFAKKNGLPS